jgi:hypothetical protein
VRSQRHITGGQARGDHRAGAIVATLLRTAGAAGASSIANSHMAWLLPATCHPEDMARDLPSGSSLPKHLPPRSTARALSLRR